jgi:isomaltose glucohydrolase
MTATTTPDSALDALVHRSIEVVAEHQDVGGAYPASPTFPVYRFSWFRDGAFIADAMSRAGRHDSAQRFFEWCAGVINARSETIDDLIARARRGESIGRDEHLPTRYTLDGRPTGEEWWDFQLDGYGTWIFMLAEHRRRAVPGEPDDHLSAAVARCVDYLCEFWAEPCFDWWEEHVDDVHVSTLASIEAGLRAAATSGLVTGARADRAAATAVRIVERIERDGVIDGHLIKTLGHGDRVDASLIAAFVPFGTFDPGGDLATSTYDRIVADLAPDGVHRYLGDTYFGGGRWVVLAGFVGAFEAVTGRSDEALRRLVWMCDQQTDDGLLPEQMTDHTLDPSYVDEWVERWGPVATPLLWSHAMYITLADEIGLTDPT